MDIKIKKLILLAGAFFIAPSINVYAALPELSLSSAILFALNNNPDINIAKEQENQSGYAIDEARSVFYPQVDLNARGGEEYNDPAGFPADDSRVGTGQADIHATSEVSLTVNQMVFDGFSSQAELKKRKKLHEASGYERSLVQDEIILETIEAYMKIFQYQNVLEDGEGFITKLGEINSKVKLMVEAGAENQAKLKYSISRLAAAKSDLTNTQASLKDAMTDLELLTGRLPTFKAQPPDVVDIVQLQLNHYYEHAEENNKTILLDKTDREALIHELQSAKGKYYPSLNMLIELTQSHDVGGTTGRERDGSAVLQMSYKIFDGFGRDASKNIAKSKINEIEYKQERAKRDIQQQIKRSYNQIKALEQEYMIVMDEIEANMELQALYDEQFSLGEGDIITLIEGEERLFTSQNRLYKIENDLIINSFKLLQQIGSFDKQQFCSSC